MRKWILFCLVVLLALSTACADRRVAPGSQKRILKVLLSENAEARFASFRRTRREVGCLVHVEQEVFGVKFEEGVAGWTFFVVRFNGLTEEQIQSDSRGIARAYTKRLGNWIDDVYERGVVGGETGRDFWQKRQNLWLDKIADKVDPPSEKIF